MGYSRKDFIDGALEEVGFASYTFDIQPEQYEGAMRRLDALMGEWNSRGIRLGYPIPSSPGSGKLNDQTDVPDHAWQAVVTNLALRIAVMFGKQPMLSTIAAASDGVTNLLREASQVSPRASNMQVSGSGNRYMSFIPQTHESALTGSDGILEV